MGSLAIRSPLGLLVAVGALLTLLSVYGLWTFRAWGWALVGLLYVVNVLYYLYEVATGITSGLLGLAIAALVLLYLYRRRDLYLSEECPVERPKDKPRGKHRNRR